MSRRRPLFSSSSLVFCLRKFVQYSVGASQTTVYRSSSDIPGWERFLLEESSRRLLCCSPSVSLPSFASSASAPTVLRNAFLTLSFLFCSRWFLYPRSDLSPPHHHDLKLRDPNFRPCPPRFHLVNPRRDFLVGDLVIDQGCLWSHSEGQLRTCFLVSRRKASVEECFASSKLS